MSRRANLFIAALFLLLLALPVAYVAYTWHPENPLRVRVLRIETPSVQPGQPPVRVLDIEMRNTSSAAVIRIGYAGVFHKTGNVFIATPHGEIPVPLDDLVLFGGAAGSPGSYKKEIVIPPQGRWVARVYLPLSETETGPLEDCTVAYEYSSSTRFRILMFCRGMAGLLPDSWLKYLFPDPRFGHLPKFEFPEGRTPLEPAS